MRIALLIFSFFGSLVSSFACLSAEDIVTLSVYEGGILTDTATLQSNLGSSTQASPSLFGIRFVALSEPEKIELRRSNSSSELNLQVRSVELEGDDKRMAKALVSFFEAWAVEPRLDSLQELKIGKRLEGLKNMDELTPIECFLLEAKTSALVYFAKEHEALDLLRVLLGGVNDSVLTDKSCLNRLVLTHAVLEASVTSPEQAQENFSKLINNAKNSFGLSDSTKRYIEYLSIYRSFFGILKEFVAGKAIIDDHNFSYLRSQANLDSKGSNWLQTSQAKMFLAQALWFKGELKGGVSIFESALPLLEEKASKWQLAAALSNLSNLYISDGDYYQALTVSSRALDLARAVNDDLTVPYLLAGMARIYLALGEFDLSAIYANRSANLFSEVGDGLNQALSIKAHGDAIFRKGFANQAMVDYEKTLSFFESDSSYAADYGVMIESIKQSVIQTHLQGNSQTKIQNSLGSLDCVISFDSLRSQANFERKRNIRKLNVGLAYYHLKAGDFDSLANCISVLESGQLGDPTIKDDMELVSLKIALRVSLNQMTSAAGLVRQLMELSETLRDSLDTSVSAIAISNTLHSGLSPYIRALLINDVLSTSDEPIRQALDLLESTTYLNLRRQRFVNSGLVSNKLSEDQIIESLEASEWAFLTSQGPVEKEIAIEQAVQSYQSFATRIKQKAPTTQLQTLTSIDWQNRLKPGEILVRYYLSQQNLFVFKVSSTSIEAKTIDLNRRELRASIERINKVYKNKDPNFSDHSTELTQLLELNNINWQEVNSLIVIADEVLEFVPFSSLLVDGEVGAKPISAHAEVVRAFSASDYFSEQKDSTDTQSDSSSRYDLVLFANPVYEPAKMQQRSEVYLTEGTAGFRNWSQQMRPLAGTEKEALAIANIFADNNVLFNLKEQANRSALFSKNTRSAKIVHLATHGFYEPTSPFLAGLALSKSWTLDSGFVSLMQLKAAPFKSNLVVLSGCETSLGVSYSGEAVNGIANTFLGQGAGSVISTLWPVSDKVTALFIADFYQSLVDNKGNASVALQSTKNKFAQRGRYKHPFYWAGFILSSSSRSVHTNIFQ